MAGRLQVGSTLRGVVCLGLAVAAFAETVTAQPVGPQRHRVRRFAALDDPEKAAPAPFSIDERLAELEQLETRITGKPVDRGALKERVSPIVARINLSTPNAYSADSIRYVLMEVVLVNPTGKEAVLQPREATLTADGKTFRSTDVAPLRNYGIQFMNGDSYSPTDLVTENSLPTRKVIPPKSEVTTRWVFCGLSRGRNVPAMSLSVPVNGVPMTVDLNAQARARLGMTVETIGPRKCLAFIEVRGELDTVNMADLVSYLDGAPAAGVTRAVIHGGQTPGWLNESMRSWFLMSRTPHAAQQFSQMPSIPGGISELHIVLPKQPTPEEENTDDEELLNAEEIELAEDSSGSQLHESLPDAVQEALRTALEALPPDQLVKEIHDGHRLARAAALAQGGSRLGPELYSLVESYVDGKDELLTSAGIIALGEIRDPKAVRKLESILMTGTPRLARIAMESLASSRFQEFHEVLVRHLDEKTAVPAKEAIEVLAGFAHPDWNDRLLKHCDDGEVDVRLAALKALRRIGHPQLLAVLKRLVRDPDDKVRIEAFNILVDRPDAESEGVAMEICLERLSDKKTTDNDLQIAYGLLYRTRDVRAVPPLLERFDALKEGRSQVIGLLGMIGGSDVIDRLIRDYPKLGAEEKGAVLSLLSEQNSLAGRDLAIAEIRGEDNNLREIGLRYLVTIADPELIPLIRQQVEKKVTREQLQAYLQTLYQVGGPDARTVLHQLRKTIDKNQRELVSQMIQNLYMRSPGWQFIDGMQRNGMGNARQDHEKMVEVCDIALDMDSLLPLAWSSRGNSYLWLGKLDEAERDFRRSMELDDENPNALTGVAIVLVRKNRIDEGLGLLAGVEKRYLKNYLFLYNSACAYGRAVEMLEKQPPSSERETKLAKYRKKGLADLQQSLKSGFTDFPLMEMDPDIATLRALPEYNSVKETRPPATDAEEDEEKPAEEAPAEGAAQPI